MPNEWITQQGEHVSLHGEWTLRHYAELKRALQQQGRLSSAALSLPGFEGLDTAGAALIVELIGVENQTNWRVGKRSSPGAAGLANTHCRGYGRSA